MSTTLQEFSGNATEAVQTVAQIVQAKASDVDQQVLQTDNDLTDGHDHRFGHSNWQILERLMRNQPHLNKTIDDWERLWKLLNKKLSMLNEQLRLETRSDEKLRLSNLIEKTKIQLDQALLNYIHQRGVVIY